MQPNVEDRLVLDMFELRDYQAEIFDAVELKGYRKVLALWPRRAGKDLTVWNLAIRHALRKTSLIFYCLPTFTDAKKVIWDGITIDGKKFLDYIPKQLIANLNQSELKITFKNDSIIRLIGSNQYDSMRGVNASMVIFSEWAYCESEAAYDVVRPMLAANDGVVIFLTTPWGKNHVWRQYVTCLELDDWWVTLKKTSDIQHIDEEILELEKSQMSHEKYMQEYECSFIQGVDGCVYAHDLRKMEQEQRITNVSWEPGLLTHVAMDIGVSGKNNATTLIWFQTIANNSIIKIIDCYSNFGFGLDHYIDIMSRKPYQMDKYIAPHDIAVREFGGGAVSRYEKARQLGITFTILPQASIEDGIENVRTHFPKIWIDQTKCKSFVDALENYYYEWNEQRQMYGAKPVHSWASNYADALRYMCQGLYKTVRGLTPEEFERKKAEALYGNKPKIPLILDKNFKY